MNLIVALTHKKNGIGKDNTIPWHIKQDLKFFKDITSFSKGSKNIVIMGRKTWESIPEKFRPLSGRINIILSRTLQKTDKENDVYFVNSLESALKLFNTDKSRKVFIIGGESIYKEALEKYSKLIEYIYVTEIYKNYDCDTFFPVIDKEIYKIKSVSPFKYCEKEEVYFRNINYINKKVVESTKGLIYENVEEKQYIDLLKKIVKEGCQVNDRTGVGTISVFGERLKYNLRDHFPMITTKRMFVRGIFEELLLYISGKTNNKILQDKKIHIWDGNTSREFLDKRGLNDYLEGDMGETYGFNFRHYGALYKGCQHDYTGQGFDQLQNAIDLIRNNPASRRIIINLFNPATQHKAALPACLCQYQFHVNSIKKELNLQIYIRSSDFFLANNWNACTGAFLVHLICNLNDIDLVPGDLTVITGDTHIYKNHMEAVLENIERTPLPPCKLIIKNKYDKIEDFKYSDVEIVGYSCYPGFKVEMAV